MPPIIEHYRADGLYSVFVNPKATLHTREWDTDLALKDGSKVIVTGAANAGGRITVRYPTSGRESVAADAGDYVYPSDVRLNAQKDRLYVKASGLAAGIGQKLGLFEYDLHSQKLVDRRKVANEALPAECPELSRVK